MLKIKEFLVVGVGLVFLVACSTAKKTTVLQNPQTAVIKPSEVVENTVIPKDTVTLNEQITQQANQQNQIDPNAPLSPEEQAKQLFTTGIHKEYDFAQAMHYDWRKPSYVMIHHTSQNSTAQTIRTFQLPHTKVSSHYVIGRDGSVVQMLNDYMRGWHAGRGKWGQITDMNSVSIGIELDNNGFDAFPEPQINALLTLLDTLKTRYSIPQLNFIGHSDFAPGRKDDPNVLFPWDRLAARGFGIWFNESYLMPAPATFNPIDALKLMGYDMKNESAVIRAFKKKYVRTDMSPVLTDRDKAIIYDLYRKYY